MVDDIAKQRIEEGCTLFYDDPAYYEYRKYCNMIEPLEWCKTTPRLLDFVYDRLTESWKLDDYETNQDLIAKVQSGAGDILSDRTRAVWVQTNYGSTRPKVVEQDNKTFKNDLYAAKYMIYRMNFDKRRKSDGYDKDWYIDFHELV